MSSAASNLARLRRIQVKRAELAGRSKSLPPRVGVARDARIAHLVSLADPMATPTPRNRRACRVAALMYAAQDRAPTTRKEAPQ